jgi:hypothetical protein
MMTTGDRLMAWSVVGGRSEGGDGGAAVHVPVVLDAVIGGRWSERQG